MGRFAKAAGQQVNSEDAIKAYKSVVRSGQAPRSVIDSRLRKAYWKTRQPERFPRRNTKSLSS